MNNVESSTKIMFIYHPSFALSFEISLPSLCSLSSHCFSLPLFQVINNNGSAEFVVSTNRTFSVSPEFIGSRLLLKMRKMAERQLGVPIEKAVISVPAEFDERQRNYTVRAANLAG